MNVEIDNDCSRSDRRWERAIPRRVCVHRLVRQQMDATYGPVLGVPRAPTGLILADDLSFRILPYVWFRQRALVRAILRR